jgi:hypothetical protein
MAEVYDHYHKCNCRKCVTSRQVIGGLNTLVPGIVDEALSTLGTNPAYVSSDFMNDIVDALADVIAYDICVSGCLSALMFHCGLMGTVKVDQLIVDRPELVIQMPGRMSV